jgi:lipopolysaccharide export system protein LptA
MKIFLLLLLLFVFSSFSPKIFQNMRDLNMKTSVESEEAHYNGELITLKGSVSISNAIGRVRAELATLKRDVEKKTKIDFPWIELKESVTLQLNEGGTVGCDSLSLDYTQMSGIFTGNPQVTYSDLFVEVRADKAQIDFREIDGTLEVIKVSLFDNVQLSHFGTAEKPTSQYALADEVEYYPQEKLALLTGKKDRVLFYDSQRDVQLSARSIRAQRDPTTKKESIQGIGDVRLTFGVEELEKIKTYLLQK